MKIRNDFVMRKIAGETVIVPIGAAAKEYNGLITVNEVGEYIWSLLENEITETEIVSSILHEFDNCEENVVKQDVSEFINKLKNHRIIQ